MQRVMAVVSEEQRRLEEAPFFQWIKTPGDDQVKLRFIPAMYFYVMAFRDLLCLLGGEDDGALQTAVNAYVDEDGAHYRWYLDDLALAGFPPMDSLRLFDRRLLPARRAIYRMIGYALDHQDPVLRATLVTIFEATGTVFFRHTIKLMQRLQLDDKLGYFGLPHYEDEVNHSVKMDELGEIVLTQAQYELASDMVRKAFAEYRGLFQSWMRAALEYDTEVEPFEGGVTPVLAEALAS
jgi:hypothetical protein